MSELVETKRSQIPWGLILKITVSLLILGVIAVKNDWAAMGRELRGAHPGWLGMAFLCMGLSYVFTSFRWRYLLQVQGIHLTTLKTGFMVMIGIFFNQFLPASTGGDMIKVFYIMKQAPDRKARAALSIGLDRILGLIAILGVTMLLVPLEFQRLFANNDIKFFIIALGLILCLVFLGLGLAWFTPLDRLPLFFHRLWEKAPKRDVIHSLYEGFHAHRHAPGPSLLALAFAVLTVIPVLGVGYLLARALDLDISYPQMTILFAMVLCSMSIPVSFGGHGLREAAFVLLFGIFGVHRAGILVGPETAFACSTLFLMVSVTWSLIGGVVYLCYSHALKAHDIRP